MYLTQLHYNMKRCIIQYTFTICSFSVHTNQVFYKCAGLCAGAESEESMKERIKYIVKLIRFGEHSLEFEFDVSNDALSFARSATKASSVNDMRCEIELIRYYELTDSEVEKMQREHLATHPEEGYQE